MVKKLCMCPPCYQGLFDPENHTHPFICKNGRKLIIRPAYKDDFEAIHSMYDLYEPKESAQGLPPADPVRRRCLVSKILEQSVSIVAEVEGVVVGHVGLIDIEPGIRSELVIVIHQDYQDRGLGSMMVGIMLDIARRCKYHKIWLTVDIKNRKVVKVLQKHGFVFVGPFDSEREMELIFK